MDTPLDEDYLNTWLDAKDTLQRQTVSVRNSLRTLPFAVKASASLRDPLLLACFRASITAAVNSIESSKEITRAADSSLSFGETFAAAAHEAANCAANSVLSALEAGSAQDDDAIIRSINSSFDAAFAAGELTDATQFKNDPIVARGISGRTSTDARASVQNALLIDMESVGRSKGTLETYRQPLWPVNPSIVLATAVDELRIHWSFELDRWSFWARWYDGMLSGIPLDLELQKRVALIDDAVWSKGPDAIAKEIQAELLPVSWTAT